MGFSSDEMSLLQLYRTAKMQLGWMIPNLANLTLMSITPQNGMVALHSQLSCSLKCQWTTSKLLAILHLEYFPAIQHHRNSVTKTYPALQIRAAVRPRPMKNHHPKGRKGKGMARKNGPRQPKNWHDPQLTSGKTTWYRWIRWPACPHHR